jgi:ring-1,2-phenylacetyl-CoA epoxidase subunit PaaC
MQAAIDDLWMYTGEMFVPDDTDLALIDAGVATDIRAIEAPWRRRVDAGLLMRHWQVPAKPAVQPGATRGGKQGVHTEHLGHLLAEMQFLQRAYPDAQW